MSGLDQPKLTAQIDFIEVDMPRPTRSACDDARVRLDKAIDMLSQPFEELGLKVNVREIRVRTAQEAELLRVRGSPTIRIGAADIFPEHGDDEARVWHWRGQEYPAPPAAMFTEALLKVAAEPHERARGAYEVPAYLRRFLSAGAVSS